MLKIRTSKSVIRNLESQLVEFEAKLKEIQKEENKFVALVNLFDLMSKMEDDQNFQKELEFLKKRNNKKFESERESLNILCLHIARCGRDKYGMNRTNYGETVTGEKVFLGDVFGISTLSVSQCLKKEKELKEELRTDVAKDPNNPPTMWYLLHDYQAGLFIENHVKESLGEIAAMLS
ncbi:hypothetical protein K9M50_00820 [Patescibacteria group bacterium]|nr:hypothetical protein [Patescibacteria group bacterium]